MYIAKSKVTNILKIKGAKNKFALFFVAKIKIREVWVLLLRKNGKKGLMLSCAADNDGAIRFYKRNGFKVLSVMAGGCAMAVEL